MKLIPLLLILPLLAFSEPEPQNAMASLSDQFMEQVQGEKYSDAFDLLKPYWPLEENNYNNLIDQTVEQMGGIKGNFGAVTGTDFVRAETIGSSYLRFIYLQKFEKSALRWRITFYNPSGNWLVHGVSWDDSVDSLFK